MVDVSIKAGTRAFICGTSGSGKTTLALRLCEAMPSPLVILDTKYDPAVAAWARKQNALAERGKATIKMVTLKKTQDMPDWRKIDRDMVIRPSPAWLSHPEDLDWWLGQAFECKYRPSIYIAEGYQVGATANKMGEGVTGLWTRSRAFGFRCLFGAQRPAWISKFVMTESDVLFIGRLNNLDDRKTIVNTTGEPLAIDTQERHHFLYIRQDGSNAVRLKPVDLSLQSAYVPENRNKSRTPREVEGGFFSRLWG